MIRKVVSGGQTGADQAALAIALRLGIPCGGWVPRGRLCESGPIPDRFPGLFEAETENPAERTRLNVRDSDATLLLTRGCVCKGSAWTLETARRQGKPHLHLDLTKLSIAEATFRLRDWIERTQPFVLNVAGPRASNDPQIGFLVEVFLGGFLLTVCGQPDVPQR
jgi:hypothetical protein